MTNTTYNGWTNYATWRIALEWFDSNDFNITKDTNVYDLSKDLQAYITDALETYTDNDTILSYALAFIDEVNWYEIAQHLIEEEVTNE